jgi:glycosyltransferase involved in cell wall biosynthesis
VATHRLPDTALLGVLTGRAARRRGLTSYNERLYFSPRTSAVVRALVAAERIDVVVADGVRLAAYAEDSGRPWFVDLDDLLSERYALWRDRAMDLHQLLGHRRPAGRLPAALLRRVRVRRILTTEAERLRAREVEIARSAHGTSLVSPLEAARLAERSGAPVQALPMAVTSAVSRRWPPGGEPLDRRLAFPGSLTAFANEEAVRWWIDELEPRLRAAGLHGWELHVFGEVPPTVRARVQVPGVVLRGAMPREELHAELVRHQFLLAPQREALGLTVKVVEAAVLGLVPITTPQGASGLGVDHGGQVLLFRDGDGLARALATLERWAADGGGATAALADRARAWARESFSAQALTSRWAEVVDGLVGAGEQAEHGGPHHREQEAPRLVPARSERE